MNTKSVVTGGSSALLALLVFFAASATRAQDARLQINHLDRLAARASESVEITMNDVHAQFLSKLVSLSQSDQSKIKGLLSKLKGIYVRGFEFAQDGEYSDADIEAIRAQLRAPGWERIVEARDRNSSRDEVYFMPRNNEIAGFAAISTEPRKVCVINIVGSMDLEDMALLEREFQLTRCGKSNIGRQRRNTR
ncbi:MAG TPA: DUF4252 domain-containing protein [Blastocatellia bacterium]|nr:DUF4252 domain-containing protein [Blastocatellia bacterium]